MSLDVRVVAKQNRFTIYIYADNKLIYLRKGLTIAQVEALPHRSCHKCERRTGTCHANCFDYAIARAISEVHRIDRLNRMQLYETVFSPARQRRHIHWLQKH